MRICILMGSPRADGNTAAYVSHFREELLRNGAAAPYILLKDKKIACCAECYHCQNVQDRYGCAITDDMDEIVDEIISSDCLVLATPIFSWYCTGEMKILLDRLYGMDKYYGTAKGNLWNHKKIALITTHGYDRDYAAEPFEMGIKRFCEHSKLQYLGMLSMRDGDDDDWKAPFLTDKAKQSAEAFAKMILEQASGSIS